MKLKLPLREDFLLHRIESHWSVSSRQLTAKGEAELMRLFGNKLEECYTQLVDEPFPASWWALLTKLDAGAKRRE